MSQTLTSIFASIFALGLVLALAWALIKTMAVLNRTNRQRGLINVVDTLPIGSRERIIVVSYKNTEYLLGSTAQGVTLLDKNKGNIQEDTLR